MSNVRGEEGLVVVNRNEDFEAFDDLPPELRNRLNDAKFQFCALNAKETLQRFGLKNTLLILAKTEQNIIDRGYEQNATPSPYARGKNF